MLHKPRRPTVWFFDGDWPDRASLPALPIGCRVAAGVSQQSRSTKKRDHKICTCTYLFCFVFVFLSAENAAEEELRRENADHKDSGEFPADFFSVVDAPKPSSCGGAMEPCNFVALWPFVHAGDPKKGGIPSVVFCVCENVTVMTVIVD